MISDGTLSIIAQVVALLFAVAVHESAHGLVALRCGDTTARDLGRISLNPLRHIDPVGSVIVPFLLAWASAPVFGWAKPVPISLARTRDPRTANLLISAAGPISNFLLAACFAAVLLLLEPNLSEIMRGSWIDLLLRFVAYSILVNIALGLFNLLPIPPLDGFGVLESLLPRSLAPLAAGLRRWGMLLLLAVIMSGALSSILVPAQRAVLRWLFGA